MKYIDADFLGDPVHHRAAFLGEFVAERHEFFRRLADGFRVRSGAVAERAQLNVLGRELVPQRRGLVGEFLHDGIVLRFLFLRERLVNAVLIRPLLSPVAVVTVVGRCQRLPGNPAYREESGKGYGDRGFIEAH